MADHSDWKPQLKHVQVPCRELEKVGLRPEECRRFAGKRLIVVRDGESRYNADLRPFADKCIDPEHVDSALTEFGRQQAIEAGEFWQTKALRRRVGSSAPETPDLVLSSPLKRAIDTAVSIFRIDKGEIIKVPDLVEKADTYGEAALGGRCILEMEIRTRLMKASRQEL